MTAVACQISISLDGQGGRLAEVTHVKHRVVH